MELGWFNYFEGPLATLLGVPLGTALAFMTAIVTISIPESMILKKVMKWQLLALFFKHNHDRYYDRGLCAECCNLIVMQPSDIYKFSMPSTHVPY